MPMFIEKAGTHIQFDSSVFLPPHMVNLLPIFSEIQVKLFPHFILLAKDNEFRSYCRGTIDIFSMRNEMINSVISLCQHGA